MGKSRDPWITWMDALPLLGRDEDAVRIGAVAALGNLARTTEELRRPTVEVLRSALNEWAVQGNQAERAGRADEAARALLRELDPDSSPPVKSPRGGGSGAGR